MHVVRAAGVREGVWCAKYPSTHAGYGCACVGGDMVGVAADGTRATATDDCGASVVYTSTVAIVSYDVFVVATRLPLLLLLLALLPIRWMAMQRVMQLRVAMARAVALLARRRLRAMALHMLPRFRALSLRLCVACPWQCAQWALRAQL